MRLVVVVNEARDGFVVASAEHAGRGGLGLDWWVVSLVKGAWK